MVWNQKIVPRKKREKNRPARKRAVPKANPSLPKKKNLPLPSPKNPKRKIRVGAKLPSHHRLPKSPNPKPNHLLAKRVEPDRCPLSHNPRRLWSRQLLRLRLTWRRHPFPFRCLPRLCQRSVKAVLLWQLLPNRMPTLIPPWNEKRRNEPNDWPRPNNGFYWKNKSNKNKRTKNNRTLPQPVKLIVDNDSSWPFNGTIDAVDPVKRFSKRDGIPCR
mmetsp:Transcript_13103/g.27178  ORF Transcript_13103/g.27178 Transcript_13103/m.27178 type:complete len:216 (+) Transcript_13103:561-1208(+)